MIIINYWCTFGPIKTFPFLPFCWFFSKQFNLLGLCFSSPVRWTNVIYWFGRSSFHAFFRSILLLFLRLFRHCMMCASGRKNLWSTGRCSIVSCLAIKYVWPHLVHYFFLLVCVQVFGVKHSDSTFRPVEH